jgi:hypothetical protein
MDLPLFPTPATVLLGIIHLINTHTSDSQHEEPCRWQQR